MSTQGADFVARRLATAALIAALGIAFGAASAGIGCVLQLLVK